MVAKFAVRISIHLEKEKLNPEMGLSANALFRVSDPNVCLSESSRMALP
jgi:hypothetical protein